MGDLSAPGADVRALETRAAGNGKNQAPDDKWVGPERAPPDVKRRDIAERQGNANESREETRLAPVRGPEGRPSPTGHGVTRLGRPCRTRNRRTPPEGTPTGQPPGKSAVSGSGEQAIPLRGVAGGNGLAVSRDACPHVHGSAVHGGRDTEATTGPSAGGRTEGVGQRVRARGARGNVRLPSRQRGWALRVSGHVSRGRTRTV